MRRRTKSLNYLLGLRAAEVDTRHRCSVFQRPPPPPPQPGPVWHFQKDRARRSECWTYAGGQLLVNRYTAVVLQKRDFSQRRNSSVLRFWFTRCRSQTVGVAAFYLHLVSLNEFQMALGPVICQWICYRWQPQPPPPLNKYKISGKTIAEQDAA